MLLDLAKQDWNAVLSATTVHSKVEALHHIINQILDKHCPFKTVKLRSDQPGWMTNRLRNLIESRDRAFRKKKRTLWRSLRSKVQRAVRAAKRDYVQETLNSQQNTKQWWNTLNSITKPQKPDTNCAPIIDGLPMLPQVFCDRLNAYYASVGGDYINSPENPKTTSKRYCT